MNKTINKIKKMVAVFSMCGMVLAAGIPVYAAYDTHHTTVGNATVTMETGYTGSTAYAKVTADTYVDAKMNGTIEYLNPTGTATLSGSFSERTYGEISKTVSGNISKVTCKFKVTSSNGTTETHTCIAK